MDTLSIVKQLLLQRRQGESRLVKREVAREDYVNYVARDAIMLKLIQKRRKKANYFHKLSEIEYVFVGKLNRVMKRAHRLWVRSKTFEDFQQQLWPDNCPLKYVKL